MYAPARFRSRRTVLGLSAVAGAILALTLGSAGAATDDDVTVAPDVADLLTVVVDLGADD